MASSKRSPSPDFAADISDHEDKRLKTNESAGEAQAALANNPTAPQEPSSSVPDGCAAPPGLSPPNDQAVIDPPRDEEPKAKPTRALLRDGRSPSPSGDVRIPLWSDETRAFGGEVIVAPRRNAAKQDAKIAAREAQRTPLVVDGKPQFNLFVDGSHQSGTDHYQTGKPPTFACGGYGVVFRNPYQGQGASEFDNGHPSETWDSTQEALSLQKAKEDRFTMNDFNIRSWRSYRVFSSRHAEMAAISQALETVITLVKRHKPSSGVKVNIFSDSKDAINRINRPPLPLGRYMRKSDALSMPLLRAIIWQSHYLSEEWNCEIKLQWLPRCCVLAHKLADHVAGWWRNGDKHASDDGADVIFQQKDRPVWRRNGMIDALHEDLAKVVDRINKREIREPRRPLPSQRQMFVESSLEVRRQASEDMLHQFAGSAMQERMRGESLLEVPPVRERNASFSMVNEDMARISEGGRSKKK